MRHRTNTERLELADAIEDGRAPGAELDGEAGRLVSLARRLEALPAEAWDPPDAPAPPPQLGPARRVRRSLVLSPAAAMACVLVLLAVGLAAGRALDGGGTSPPRSRVALAPVAGAGEAAGRVSFDDRPGGRIQVAVDGLRPSTGHSYYELWLMSGDGRLVSVGTFRVPAGGHGEIQTRLPVAPRSYEFLDISREPDDGNPTHSSASVLRGPTGRS